MQYLWNMRTNPYVTYEQNDAYKRLFLKRTYLLLHMVSSKHSGVTVVYYLLLCFVYSCILVYVLILYSTLANSCCF